jgi:hypothetical protein
VPDVVTAALGPDGEALVVTREPEVDPLELAGEVSNETLHQLWEQAARLHEAGISHGRLNLSNVILVGDQPVLLDLSAATLGAPQSAIDIDVAELLVACTVLVGPDRALKAALDGVGKDAVGTALPYLQRAALTPHVRDLARTHEVALKDLREAAATATGREKPPELEPLRRVSAKKLLMTALLAVAAYGIITQLADIGFGTIADEPVPLWGSRRAPDRGDRDRARCQRDGDTGRPEAPRQGRAAVQARIHQPLDGDPQPTEATGALRRKRRVRSAVRDRPGRHVPRLRRRPLAGAAHPRQHGRLGPVELHPLPGGIGAAEASLTAGLVAMGVDESTAFAIAFTQRLCTFYLPPIWGYFSLRWLSRKAYI